MTGEAVQPTSKGVRVNGSNTPPKILLQLPDSGRGWYILKPHDYPTEIRSSSHLKVFNKKGRSQTSGSRSDRDYIFVFEKLCSNNNNSGGGGSNNSNTLLNVPSSALAASSNSTQVTDTEAVNIINPKNETVVERRKYGVPTDGSAFVAKSVKLDWGSGGETKSVRDESWETTLPIGHGEHELTATVAGDSKSVKFTVVLKPVIKGYTSEEIQGVLNDRPGHPQQGPTKSGYIAIDAGLLTHDEPLVDKGVHIDEVKSLASAASGDYNLFYSGSGD